MITLHGTVVAGSFEKQCDLDVGNEILGVVGANGTGKTTLLRTLAGLHGLASGELTMCGEVVDSPSQSVFVQPEHRHIGMVFQDHALIPFLTARENVAFPLVVRGENRGAATKLAQEHLEQFGVAEVGSQVASSLSGGQSQRVAIARALIGSPKVVLLDEPLSAIDEESRSGIREVIGRRLEALGVPALIVSHNLEDVRQICTRIENYTR